MPFAVSIPRVVGALCSLLAFGLLFGWFFWRWSRRSMDPPAVLIGKLIVTLVVGGGGVWCGASFHPLIGIPLGLLTLALYAAVLLLAYVGAGIAIGHWALQRWWPASSTPPWAAGPIFLWRSWLAPAWLRRCFWREPALSPKARAARPGSG